MLKTFVPRSLSAKLVLAGGGTVTAILIATSLTTAWQTKHRVEEAVLSQATAEAQGIANDVATKLVDAGSAADAMTGSITAVYGGGLHDRAVVVAMLKANLERYPNVFGSWFAEAPAAFDGSSDPKGLGANAKGVFTPYWTKPTASTVAFSTFDAKYETPWYALPASTRKGAITEPYLSLDGVMMTSAAYPVLSDGKVIGVAGMDLRLETLSNLLGALKPFGDGRVMLLSSSGHWVANPDAKLLTKPYADDGAADVTASLADGKPRILRGVDGGANARIVLPFQVPGLNATWATVMDVPEATFSTIADREMRSTILMGLGMLLAVLAALYVATRLVLRQPLAALVRSVETLERGDYETPVAGQGRQDEAGALGRALEGFRHALADGHRNEQLVGLERQKADLMRGETEAHHADQAAEQAHVVANLAKGLSRLSAGDLTTQLNEPFAGQYDALRVDFNATVAALGTVLQGVIDTAAAIRSGSGEISTAADDLSRRTEQQAASLEETAAALDEITATVRKTAEGSKHARTLVGTATKHADHSAEVVRHAVGAMTGIQASSREITQIIGVIDEIAFQTNLLALNAGVEAARAGDAGRGFAVVASEVRALAQRSAEAAKEIKTLISASGRQVEQGVAFVGQTGEALARIAAQVAEIDGIVGEMAASAHEQASGLDQVNTAVNQMDQVTQQNAAMVEQSTAASHGLRQETEELVRLIGRFRLDGERSPAAHNVVALAPAAGRRPAARPLPVATRGGAALKPRVEPAQALWEEF